jgi:type VI protein secretion system component VasF
MRKRLFSGEDEHYNEEGSELDRRAAAFIEPLVQECVAKGYSLRDVAYILSGAVDSAVLSAVIGLGIKVREEKTHGN